ncbi:MAG: FecR family protein [Desulfobaccales bacterium]
MRKFIFFWVVFVILAFQVAALTSAQADVVGRLTQVEGRVDILRGGQLPATPVKVDDGVETGDVIRTKSLSKAQITFIDNSTMSIAPESRVGIEAYMVDSTKEKRNAVIQLFQGLAHVVVSKVFKSAEPDFIVKTNTAVMGVRGTDFGIRLQPNSSTILNFEGVLQVGNIFPEVGQLPQRAFKVAYSFGSEGEGGHHWVFLKEMFGTTVGQGLPPTLPYKISLQDMQNFMQLMNIGVNICRRNNSGSGESGGGAPSDPISGCAATTGDPGTADGGSLGGLYTGFFQAFYSLAYTPPKIPPKTQTTLLSTESLGTPENPPTPPPCDHKWRHHFHFDRDFFCHRNHDGQFEDFSTTNPITQDHLANIPLGWPMAGHFRGPGSGSGIPNIILTSAITNPTVFFSHHFPGNACRLPGVGDHQGGTQVAQHLKPKTTVHQYQGPGGQNGGPPGHTPPGAQGTYSVR